MINLDKNVNLDQYRALLRYNYRMQSFTGIYQLDCNVSIFIDLLYFDLLYVPLRMYSAWGFLIDLIYSIINFVRYIWQRVKLSWMQNSKIDWNLCFYQYTA